MSDFHTAVGQFVNYRLVLGKTDPERVLYLAVAEFAYVSLLGTEFGQLAIEAHQLKLIVFDEEQGVVTQWIE